MRQSKHHIRSTAVWSFLRPSIDPARHQPAEESTRAALSGFSAALHNNTLHGSAQRGLRAIVWTIVDTMWDNGWMFITRGRGYVWESVDRYGSEWSTVYFYCIVFQSLSISAPLWIFLWFIYKGTLSSCCQVLLSNLTAVWYESLQLLLSVSLDTWHVFMNRNYGTSSCEVEVQSRKRILLPTWDKCSACSKRRRRQADVHLHSCTFFRQ